MPEDFDREKYLREQAARSDFFGTWLDGQLTGKRKAYLVNERTHERVDDSPSVPGMFSVHYDSNSMENLLLACVYGIEIHWDQWVRCVIICQHGRFSAVSDFFNITEAVVRAIMEFNEADHPADEEDDDDEEAAEELG